MKIDTKLILKQYEDNLPIYEKLVEVVEYELKKSINKKHIKIHAISYRIKEPNSLLDKIRRKKLLQPFDQVHDIVGFRVVCLFLTDLEEINKIVHNIFDVFDEDDKINNSEINIFGYMSLHLKCRLKSSNHNNMISNTPFEVQVRTIAQDAWASISHYLDYKKESLIPEQFKRDFYALSGLFYVADTHFSILQQEQSAIYLKTKGNSTTNRST